MSSSDRLFPKRFGQVLLRSRDVARFEVDSLEIGPGNRILEIGPGEGALTELILERGDATLDCVEADSGFAEALKNRFHQQVTEGRLKVIKGDFLKSVPGRYDRIIGNIPYHISSPIIFRLSDYDFDLAILMVQKDFAERMVATPGSKDYSRLSVNCAYRFRIEILMVVEKESFHPVPKVDSAIVRIRKSDGSWPVSPQSLDKLLVTLFSKRRKKVGSVIKGCPDEVRDKRPEQLTLEEFISVAMSLNLP